jgi:hypothetical protein
MEEENSKLHWFPSQENGVLAQPNCARYRGRASATKECNKWDLTAAQCF